MASEDAINTARNKFLQAAADQHAINPGPQDLKAVAMDAGYKGIEGKAFRKAVQNLKQEGLLNRSKNVITWTDKGIADFPEAKAPPSQEERQTMFFEKLCKDPEGYPGGLPSEEKIKVVFNILLDRESHTKEQLAKAAGYSATDTKKFRNLMKRLEAIKVIDSSNGKSIQLNGTMFPAGAASTVASQPPKKKAKTEDAKGTKKQSAKENAAAKIAAKPDEEDVDDKDNDSEASDKKDDGETMDASFDEQSIKDGKKGDQASEDEDGLNDPVEDSDASAEEQGSEWEED